MVNAANVTMAHVGQRAGVSARTVSNVLSGNSAVRPATRERVLVAVAEVFVARLRVVRVPQLLAGSFVLALLAVSSAYFLA